MDDIQLRLIEKAIAKYKKIFPCGGNGQLEDCFTVTKNKLFFWFNTEDNNTHVIEEILSKKNRN